MKQREWTAEEKFTIVMEGLKGQKTVSEICKEHALSQTVYYKWRDVFLEGGKNTLENGGKSSKDKTPEADIERLQKIIGKQAVQIEILKKTEELFTTR